MKKQTLSTKQVRLISGGMVAPSRLPVEFTACQLGSPRGRCQQGSFTPPIIPRVLLTQL